MASISGYAKADKADLVGNLTLVIGVGDEEDIIAELIEWPRLKGACVEYPTVILVYETLNGRRAASGSESRITAKDFLEYYAVKYITATDGAYLSSSSSRPCFFDLSSAGRVWNDNLLWVSGECLQRSDEEPQELNNRTITKGINCKVSRKESFIDIITREGNELEAVLKELEITLLNKNLDGPVDMATVSSTVVRNLAKRKAVKRGAGPRSVTSERFKIAEGADLRLRFEVEVSLLEDQCRAKGREKMVAVMDDEFKKLEREKEREVAALKQKEFRAESEAEAERLVTASAISWNNLAGKLYQLRYTKADIMAFREGNYKEMGIMDEEEVEEREDGMNEIESSRLRVVDLEGLRDVEKKSSAELQKKLDVAREIEEQTLLYNVEHAEEYEVLFSQYEDRLDDNLKLSLKLEEARRQVEEKTATILSRDLALNQLTSELAELKEKAVSGSRHKAELAKYRIRALNEEISDMK
ncbi:hypothetical protein GIB67_003302 [Kingdonia uniflora]|uniref:Uncharacterized protein n=1 Tax=Kingdonia uniflora TaxID=39325 RepID=A0A7J7P9J4_9MAGN|nr:hypothetical protein GIB67_003302 [Kingdonia uniflora]